MPVVTTPAVVLHVMPYGETSRIVRLMTRDLGLVSAMARGARRPRSRAGPVLDLFAEGLATLHVRQGRDLCPLSAFELASSHAALGRNVAAFSAAAALAELAQRCSGEGPHPEIFEAVTDGLTALEHAEPALADTTALAACWNLVSTLGFSPVTDRCSVCGGAPARPMLFSPAAGGALCKAHADAQGPAHRLSDGDREALRSLLAGRAPEPALDGRHVQAHKRLLLGFIRYHLAEHRTMPALAFWESEPWHATS
jgi:DNA repair protein RecO (recombination protein O)